jgi:hypothetical protein
MSYACWAMYLWPGLPDLWWRGSRTGMGLSVAFGLLANLIVAATWVWPELLGVGLGRILWAALAAVWMTLVFVSFRVAIQTSETIPSDETDFFAVAQGEYLKGNWLAAEVLARRLLLAHPSDVEAALLLTSTLRRAGRLDEARATLEEMNLWDRAAAWSHEIAGENERIAEKEAQLAEQNGLEQEVHDGGPTTLPLPNLREAA